MFLVKFSFGNLSAASTSGSAGENDRWQMPISVVAIFTLPKIDSCWLHLISRYSPPFLYSPGVIASILIKRSCNLPEPDSPESWLTSNILWSLSRSDLACSIVMHCRNVFGLTPAHLLNNLWKWYGPVWSISALWFERILAWMVCFQFLHNSLTAWIFL